MCDNATDSMDSSTQKVQELQDEPVATSSSFSGNLNRVSSLKSPDRNKLKYFQLILAGDVNEFLIDRYLTDSSDEELTNQGMILSESFALMVASRTASTSQEKSITTDVINYDDEISLDFNYLCEPGASSLPNNVAVGNSCASTPPERSSLRELQDRMINVTTDCDDHNEDNVIIIPSDDDDDDDDVIFISQSNTKCSIEVHDSECIFIDVDKSVSPVSKGWITKRKNVQMDGTSSVNEDSEDLSASILRVENIDQERDSLCETSKLSFEFSATQENDRSTDVCSTTLADLQCEKLPVHYETPDTAMIQTPVHPTEETLHLTHSLQEMSERNTYTSQKGKCLTNIQVERQITKLNEQQTCGVKPTRQDISSRKPLEQKSSNIRTTGHETLDSRSTGQQTSNILNNIHETAGSKFTGHSDDEDTGHSNGKHIRHSDGKHTGHSDNKHTGCSSGKHKEHSDNIYARHKRGKQTGHSNDKHARHKNGRHTGHSDDKHTGHSVSKHTRHSNSKHTKHSDVKHTGHSDAKCTGHTDGRHTEQQSGTSSTKQQTSGVLPSVQLTSIPAATAQEVTADKTTAQNAFVDSCTKQESSLVNKKMQDSMSSKITAPQAPSPKAAVISESATREMLERKFGNFSSTTSNTTVSPTQNNINNFDTKIPIYDQSQLILDHIKQTSISDLKSSNMSNSLDKASISNLSHKKDLTAKELPISTSRKNIPLANALTQCKSTDIPNNYISPYKAPAINVSLNKTSFHSSTTVASKLPLHQHLPTFHTKSIPSYEACVGEDLTREVDCNVSLSSKNQEKKLSTTVVKKTNTNTSDKMSSELVEPLITYSNDGERNQKDSDDNVSFTPDALAVFTQEAELNENLNSFEGHRKRELEAGEVTPAKKLNSGASAYDYVSGSPKTPVCPIPDSTVPDCLLTIDQRMFGSPLPSASIKPQDEDTVRAGNTSAQFVNDEKHKRNVFLVESLEAISKVTSVLGNLAPVTEHLLIKSAIKIEQGQDPFDLFLVTDNIIALELMHQNLFSEYKKGILDPEVMASVKKAMEMTTILLNVVNEMKLLKNYMGLDIDNIARATIGKKTCEIIHFITQQLLYLGKKEARENDIHCILMSVMNKHKELTDKHIVNNNTLNFIVSKDKVLSSEYKANDYSEVLHGSVNPQETHTQIADSVNESESQETRAGTGLATLLSIIPANVATLSSLRKSNESTVVRTTGDQEIKNDLRRNSLLNASPPPMHHSWYFAVNRKGRDNIMKQNKSVNNSSISEMNSLSLSDALKHTHSSSHQISESSVLSHNQNPLHKEETKQDNNRPFSVCNPHNKSGTWASQRVEKRKHVLPPVYADDNRQSLVYKPSNSSSPEYNPDVRLSPVYDLDVRSSPLCNPNVRSSPAYDPDVRSSPVHDPDVRSSPVYDPDVRSSPVHDPDVRSSPVYDPDVRSSPVYDPDARSSPVYDPDVRSSPMHV
ncbi:serine-rich adhesin for platelets isoform X1 [Cherax quadricarinatus]